ncbi:MAG: hypothetical protein COT74_11610 [Bdellovibrionales bacterium CG10_big_fil_rev_8_21_14_0_10_45_34]|nr:MAG: hypothetical protein COT74_11610 [Bdellovibrionales bacterium CG10_big_fil_rev_8_21_14_0_10_45_34]
MKKPLVSPSFLKQKARQLKKEKSLSQHQALEEASKMLGFSNYRNYLNLLESNAPKPKPATKEQIEVLRLDKEDIALKRAHSLIAETKKSKTQLHELLKNLKAVEKSDADVQAICEKSTALNRYLELNFFSDFLRDEECEIEDFAPYHIAKQVTLKNLAFRFEDEVLFVEGDYDLILEFAFDYDKDDKSDTFKDQEMFGSFELTIDKNLEINFENQDI